MTDQHFTIVPPLHHASRKNTVYRFKEIHILYYIVGIVEVILAFRFLVQLFAGIFEWPVLLAMAVCLIITYAIVKLIAAGTP